MYSLYISSFAIYFTTFSNDIYLSVDIISVYLKVSMHQWSVLSPQLFTIVMLSPGKKDVVYLMSCGILIT